MPRNKTFRKRNPKKIQKGGDSETNALNSTKHYYAYVVKTRKAVEKVSNANNSIGGGGGGSVIVAVPISPPEYEYKTTIIDEARKIQICADNKIIKGAGAGAGAVDNLQKFIEDESKDEVITIFKLNDGKETTLDALTITKENVKWNDYVC
jgi:hypothetical protein